MAFGKVLAVSPVFGKETNMPRKPRLEFPGTSVGSVLGFEIWVWGANHCRSVVASPGRHLSPSSLLNPPLLQDPLFELDSGSSRLLDAS